MTRSGRVRIASRPAIPTVKPDPRRGQLWINEKPSPVLQMPQTEALPAYKADAVVVDLPQGRNLIRIVALNEGGLGNTDYIKVAEVRDIPAGAVPRIRVLEAEDGVHLGKVDHHSCLELHRPAPR